MMSNEAILIKEATEHLLGSDLLGEDGRKKI